MYCVNGKPRSSLLIESTDSMMRLADYGSLMELIYLMRADYGSLMELIYLMRADSESLTELISNEGRLWVINGVNI